VPLRRGFRTQNAKFCVTAQVVGNSRSARGGPTPNGEYGTRREVLPSRRGTRGLSATRRARAKQALQLDERVHRRRLVNGCGGVEFPRFEVGHY